MGERPPKQEFEFVTLILLNYHFMGLFNSFEPRKGLLEELSFFFQILRALVPKKN